MKKLIKNGKIITASKSFMADILIDGEYISAIGDHLADDDADIIDAQGKLIMPGGIDPHCHFDLPMFGTVSSDDHYTGHKAAAFGGTTTVMDFVPQDNDNLLANVEVWRTKADPKAAVDFGFHMNISSFSSRIRDDIAALVEVGITTLKVFTAYNERLRLSDGEIFEVMRVANQNGMLTMLHAENGDVIDILVREALAAGHYSAEWHARTRPAWGAVEASLRAIALAAQAGASLYLVHMNTAGEVDQLRYGRERGVRVMGETCPGKVLWMAQ
jgi:dihydropyrimidinase